MHPLLPSLAAAALYAGATGYQSLRLAQRAVPDRRLLLTVGLLALLAHGISLFIQLISPSGLHLDFRSEEHTSELQSLMRISYAVFCLKKKRQHYPNHILI